MEVGTPRYMQGDRKLRDRTEPDLTGQDRGNCHGRNQSGVFLENMKRVFLWRGVTAVGGGGIVAHACVVDNAKARAEDVQIVRGLSSSFFFRRLKNACCVGTEAANQWSTQSVPSTSIALVVRRGTRYVCTRCGSG